MKNITVKEASSHIADRYRNLNTFTDRAIDDDVFKYGTPSTSVSSTRIGGCCRAAKGDQTRRGVERCEAAIA